MKIMLAVRIQCIEVIKVLQKKKLFLNFDLNKNFFMIVVYNMV